MKNTMRFDASNISQINQFIHDKWFIVNELLLDASSLKASMKIYNRNPYRQIGENYLYDLIIGPVNKIHLIDTEKVGAYDINELVYSQKKMEIHITTGVPLELRFYLEEKCFDACALEVCELSRNAADQESPPMEDEKKKPEPDSPE